MLLFLRPDLVSPAYKDAEPVTARDQKHRIEIAKANDWPGYWGSPRLATAAAAAARWKVGSSRQVELALKILDGFDYSQMKRFGDEIVSASPVMRENLYAAQSGNRNEAARVAQAKRDWNSGDRKKGGVEKYCQVPSLILRRDIKKF